MSTVNFHDLLGKHLLGFLKVYLDHTTPTFDFPLLGGVSVKVSPTIILFLGDYFKNLEKVGLFEIPELFGGFSGWGLLSISNDVNLKECMKSGDYVHIEQCISNIDGDDDEYLYSNITGNRKEIKCSFDKLIEQYDISATYSTDDLYLYSSVDFMLRIITSSNILAIGTGVYKYPVYLYGKIEEEDIMVKPCC